MATVVSYHLMDQAYQRAQEQLVTELFGHPELQYGAIYDRNAKPIIQRTRSGEAFQDIPELKLVRSGVGVLEQGRFEYASTRTGEKFLDITVPVYSPTNPFYNDVEQKDFMLQLAQPRSEGSQYLMGYVRLGLSQTALEQRLIEYGKWVITASVLFILLCSLVSLLMIRRITEPLAKERLRRLAYYDSLTLLPNRQFFTEQLKFLLSMAKREEFQLALLFIDLDNFKRINDSLGHTAGDRLLKEVAARLSQCIRESDLVSRYMDEKLEIGVSRLGGDEFTLVLNRVENSQAVDKVTQRLLASLARPMIIEGHELVVTPSIGIAISPQDGEDVDDLLKHADTAMYHAKNNGKNNFQHYTSTMNEMGVHRLKLETDLRRALEHEELVLHYQPQVDITTGNIVGAEAMVRWQHPEHGLVPPLNFITLAEEMGLIVELGDWVLREACKQTKIWQKQGLDIPKIAVNLSALQFDDDGFIERTGQLLKETGLSPKSLELELTESVIMKDAEATIEALHALKSMGISLSVDDFGTGYSSLNYLSQFPLDKLKIDRSFVVDVEKGEHNAGLVVAIIAMAKSLGLSLVAEGVETNPQYLFLKNKGIRVIQGFLFSGPVPAGQFEELLRNHRFDALIGDIPESAAMPVLVKTAVGGGMF